MSPFNFVNLLRPFEKKSLFKNTIESIRRNYGAPSNIEVTSSSKAVVRVTGTDSEERLRVRRSRPADIPRVLRFVKDNMHNMWPSLCAPPGISQLVIHDYVARALAQGHTMLAEQVEPRRGLASIRGMAIASSTCPWDATTLEKYARCIRCDRSRRFIDFTAHCLRLPALYDKYGVKNVLQVILIVPPDSAKSNEIIQLLARNAIQRGTDVGFQLLRFDVTNSFVGQSLEEIKLNKECESVYEVSEIPKEENAKTGSNQLQYTPTNNDNQQQNYFAVYSALTKHAVMKSD